MKLLLTILFLLTTEHSILVNANPITLDANRDYAPIWLWSFAVDLPDDKPVVDTAIKVGDKCPECKGTGTWRSGDGLEVKPCPHCKADGVVDTGDPILGHTELPCKDCSPSSGKEESPTPVEELEGSFTNAPPTDWDDKKPPITIDSSLPENNEIETYSFSYKGKTYYYNQEKDLFISSDGGSVRIELPYEEWTKEKHVKLNCQYDNNGRETSCELARLIKVKIPQSQFNFTQEVDLPIQLPGDNQVPEDYATPSEVIPRILQRLKLNPDNVFLDVGSGNGDVVIAAAKLYGCKSIGIEFDPGRINLAKQKAKESGVDHLVSFIQGDFYNIQWPQADIGYVYLYPEDLEAIRDKLLTLDKFASYMHKIPRVQMYSYDNGDYFIWKSPPKQSPLPKQSSTPGVWYGRKYYTWDNLPRNGNCNCGMCTFLKNELTRQQGLINAQN